MNLLLLLVQGDGTTEEQIGWLTEKLTGWLSHITENLWLQALIVVGASLVLAKVFDWLCTGVFKALT